MNPRSTHSERLRESVLVAITFALVPLTTLSAATVDAPTFSRDVAPIFFDRCGPCHRPGQIAPMSLLSYTEARPWAKSIARAVRSRDMPPFSGESDHYVWANDISLTDEQITTITNWVEQGAPEGDPAQLPAVPHFEDDWSLGEPDYVITLDRIDVPADGEDLFPKQIKEIDIDETRWVRAIEYLPGDRRVSHHSMSTYRAPAGSGDQGSGILAIWTAGMPPFVFPEGMGRLIYPGTKVLFDQHYHPMGEAASDITRVGLYFGEGELKKQVATLQVTNTGMRIPPGADHHAETAHTLFDQDMQILALSPHMHVRGKAMRYELTHPDGTRETLLDVPDYDYNWQWLYYPTEPIEVPAGSRLDVTAVWDNSANNPANPDPTREILFRGDTFNEMFVAFIEVVQKDGVLHEPSKARDRLGALLDEHPTEGSFLVDGFFKMAFHVPREGEGWLYLGAGLTIFSVSLDDFEWNGSELRITTQFPTAEASGTTTLIEGTVGDDGRFTGTLEYGSDTDKAMKVPIVGMPHGKSPHTASGG